jgi:hypothetical protein
MPSTKLYEGFVELGIDFSKLNADLARARSMLGGLGSGTAGGGFAAGVSAGIASGMMQGITSGSARPDAMGQVASAGDRAGDCGRNGAGRGARFGADAQRARSGHGHRGWWPSGYARLGGGGGSRL